MPLLNIRLHYANRISTEDQHALSESEASSSPVYPMTHSIAALVTHCAKTESKISQHKESPSASHTAGSYLKTSVLLLSRDYRTYCLGSASNAN